jgi:hypothetical protein
MAAAYHTHETAICCNPPMHSFTGDKCNVYVYVKHNYVWYVKYLLTWHTTMLQETKKKLDRSLTDQHLSMLCFYWNIRTNSFFFLWNNILTECVFVTQLPSNAEMSIWRIVWVTTDCCSMSDIIQINCGDCSPWHWTQNHLEVYFSL